MYNRILRLRPQDAIRAGQLNELSADDSPTRYLTPIRFDTTITSCCSAKVQNLFWSMSCYFSDAQLARSNSKTLACRVATTSQLLGRFLYEPLRSSSCVHPSIHPSVRPSARMQAPCALCKISPLGGRRAAPLQFTHLTAYQSLPKQKSQDHPPRVDAFLRSGARLNRHASVSRWPWESSGKNVTRRARLHANVANSEVQRGWSCMGKHL